MRLYDSASRKASCELSGDVYATYALTLDCTTSCDVGAGGMQTSSGADTDLKNRNIKNLMA